MLSIRVYNPAGNMIAVLDNWRSLDFTHTLNDVGSYTLSINDDTKADFFTLDCILEFWRTTDNRTWTKEFTCFHRTGQHELTEKDIPIFTSYGRGLNDLLRRRIIAYYATSAFTLKSAPAETVLKEFVNENAGPGAGYIPRWLPGIFPGLAIETDAARGPNWAGQRTFKNLLGVLQEIAESTSIDYEIVRTTGANFEFRCYDPYGTDRRSQVTFTPGFGNMVSPSYTLSRTEEVTRILVLGGDQESSRKHLYCNSVDINDSPWNAIEDTVSHNQEDGSAPSLLRMEQTGNDRLAETKKQEEFTFDVAQTYSLQYGRDYFLGDIVTARFGSIERVVKIIEVSISSSEGKESVTLGFKTI